MESLFQIELDKIFNVSDPLYDPREREEEAERMRQHVFTEIDKNGDRMISLQEFLDSATRQEFETNEEWKVSKLENSFKIVSLTSLVIITSRFFITCSRPTER